MEASEGRSHRYYCLLPFAEAEGCPQRNCPSGCAWSPLFTFWCISLMESICGSIFSVARNWIQSTVRCLDGTHRPCQLGSECSWISLDSTFESNTCQCQWCCRMGKWSSSAVSDRHRLCIEEGSPPKWVGQCTLGRLHRAAWKSSNASSTTSKLWSWMPACTAATDESSCLTDLEVIIRVSWGSRGQDLWHCRHQISWRPSLELVCPLRCTWRTVSWAAKRGKHTWRREQYRKWFPSTFSAHLICSLSSSAPVCSHCSQ